MCLGRRRELLCQVAVTANREDGQVFNLKPPFFSLSDQQTSAGDRQFPGGWGQVSCLTGKRGKRVRKEGKEGQVFNLKPPRSASAISRLTWAIGSLPETSPEPYICQGQHGTTPTGRSNPHLLPLQRRFSSTWFIRRRVCQHAGLNIWRRPDKRSSFLRWPHRHLGKLRHRKPFRIRS